MRIGLCFFIAICMAFPALASPPVVKGHLVIIGGGERTDPIMDRFIALAGGPEKARIIILPMASSVPDTTGMEQTAELIGRGARIVSWVLFNREQAMSSGFADTLNGATGIFFSGGDQSRLTAVVVGTPVHRKLMELYGSGTVMAGTSAGAAIMSRVMITGNELINKDTTNIFVSIMKGNVETIEGIGFLDNVIIDQHFVKRKRLNRLISAVLEHQKLAGVGIDESTSVVVAPDGTFEVLGEGTVVVVDGRKATGIRSDKNGNLSARNMGMHIFSSGERFSLKGGVSVLPPARP
jgi:cyanophycinase